MEFHYKIFLYKTLAYGLAVTKYLASLKLGRSKLTILYRIRIRLDKAYLKRGEYLLDSEYVYASINPIYCEMNMYLPEVWFVNATESIFRSQLKNCF